MLDELSDLTDIEFYEPPEVIVERRSDDGRIVGKMIYVKYCPDGEYFAVVLRATEHGPVQRRKQFPWLQDAARWLQSEYQHAVEQLAA